MARLLAGPVVCAAVLIALTTLVTSPPALAAATYGPATAPTLAASSTVVTPGGSVELSASGLDYPDSCVLTIVGEVIGTVSTNPNGTFSTSVVIPSNVTPGEHTITATCSRGDSATITVDIEAASGTGPVTQGSGGSGSGVLATTGTDVIAGAGTGAGAIAIGGLLVLATRRRRRSTWKD